MKTTLFLFHPSYEKSVANKRIINGLLAKNSEIVIHHVDSLYSPLSIDADAEHKALLEADNIILQFPMFWYSIPGLMKYWLDCVMGYQFAFGPHGDKLKGKTLVASITVGATKDAYTAQGQSGHPIEAYFLWIEQLGKLTQMKYKGIISSYGYSPDASSEYIEKTISQHVEGLCTAIQE